MNSDEHKTLLFLAICRFSLCNISSCFPHGNLISDYLALPKVLVLPHTLHPYPQSTCSAVLVMLCLIWLKEWSGILLVVFAHSCGCWVKWMKVNWMKPSKLTSVSLKNNPDSKTTTTNLLWVPLCLSVMHPCRSLFPNSAPRGQCTTAVSVVLLFALRRFSC